MAGADQGRPRMIRDNATRAQVLRTATGHARGGGGGGIKASARGRQLATWRCHIHQSWSFPISGNSRAGKNVRRFCANSVAAKCKLPAAHRRNESVMLANVIRRIIQLRGVYEQGRVNAVLPLPALDHRRNVNAQIWSVQLYFQPVSSIVDRHAALTVCADQELVTFLMRVFSPDFA